MFGLNNEDKNFVSIIKACSLGLLFRLSKSCWLGTYQIKSIYLFL